MNLLKALMYIALEILGAGFLGAVLLKVNGYRPFIVNGDSMTPAYEKNMLVFAYRRKFEEVTENDVIVFSGSDGTRCIHRVAAVDKQFRQLITKGDANMWIDVMPVTEEKYIGTVVFGIPFSGFVVTEYLRIKNRKKDGTGK